MDIKILTWLTDVERSIDEIFDFLPEKRIFSEYQKDLKTKKAVERNIEIIGEAIKRILDKESEFPVKNARRIVDTRNRIIHGYDSISDEIIWAIVIKELPELKLEVVKFLAD